MTDASSYTSVEVLGVRLWCCIFCCCLLCCSGTGCARATNVLPDQKVVLIDPGHGGFDGGAVATDGTMEKHINLAIAHCLHDLLYVCGVPVRMTRSTDVGLEDSNATSVREKKVTDMRRRLEMYNESAMVISIHQNHFSIPKYAGTQLFYATNHPDGVVLATAIRDAVIRWIQPQNTRELKPTTDGIYLLYHAKVPTVLVECGFLSNPEEREKLKTPAYQQQIAFAVMTGYWNYQT